MCSSPKLIAAYHVLHRLSEPRHPPCALSCFKKIKKKEFVILVVCYPTTNFRPSIKKNGVLKNCVIVIIIRYTSNNFSQYVKELS